MKRRSTKKRKVTSYSEKINFETGTIIPPNTQDNIQLVPTDIEFEAIAEEPKVENPTDEEMEVVEDRARAEHNIQKMKIPKKDKPKNVIITKKKKKNKIR